MLCCNDCSQIRHWANTLHCSSSNTRWEAADIWGRNHWWSLWRNVRTSVWILWLDDWVNAWWSLGGCLVVIGGCLDCYLARCSWRHWRHLAQKCKSLYHVTQTNYPPIGVRPSTTNKKKSDNQTDSNTESQSPDRRKDHYYTGGGIGEQTEHSPRSIRAFTDHPPTDTPLYHRPTSESRLIIILRFQRITEEHRSLTCELQFVCCIRLLSDCIRELSVNYPWIHRESSNKSCLCKSEFVNYRCIHL